MKLKRVSKRYRIRIRVRNALLLLEGDYIRRNKHRMGILARQDLEMATGYLKEIDA